VGVHHDSQPAAALQSLRANMCILCMCMLLLVMCLVVAVSVQLFAWKDSALK